MRTTPVLFALILFLLTGCAETLSERQSVAIDVVPLKHTFSVELKEQGQAFSEVEDYIDSNWEVLADANLELVVLSAEGQILSGHVVKLLKMRGKDPAQIKTLTRQGEEQFDFQLVSVNYKTFTPVCQYYQVGYFGETNTGCYVEGARWKAMTNPQKMVK
jgi:hypothetical protein